MCIHTQSTKGEERTPEDSLAWFGLEAFTANLIPAPSLLEASYILNLFTYLLSQPIKCSFEILQLLLLQAVFSKIKYTVLFPLLLSLNAYVFQIETSLPHFFCTNTKCTV